MSLYQYTARERSGKIIKGTYEANDKSMIITMIKNKGAVPLEIKESKGVNTNLSLDFLNSKITSKDLAVFCRQFSAVIEAGIPVLECMDIIRKQCESKPLKNILNSVYEQVQKGRSLSDSFREFKDKLPSIFINLVEAGEVSGTLDKVMLRLALYFNNQSKLISKVKGAMTYPIVILIVSILAVIVLMWKVVPNFVNMFKDMGAKLPLQTQILITLSNFVSKNIIFIFVGLVGITTGLVYYLKTEQGRTMSTIIMLKVPVISGVFRKLIAARFTRTMSSLLSSGIPLIQAIEITEKVIDNPLMSQYLDKVREDVTKGVKLSTAISFVRVLPPMVINMVNIGEESGSIDSMLEKTADFFEEEADSAISKLTTLIEPVILLAMSAVVGNVVVSIVQPMFSMYQNMNNM